MLLGFVVAAVLVNNQNLWLAALVALILSPTDAALGQAVVTSERLPERMRQAINVESGLNDGIALAPILMCLAALSGGEHPGQWYRVPGFSLWCGSLPSARSPESSSAGAEAGWSRRLRSEAGCSRPSSD